MNIDIHNTPTPAAKRLLAATTLLAIAACFVQPATAQAAGAADERRGAPRGEHMGGPMGGQMGGHAGEPMGEHLGDQMRDQMGGASSGRSGMGHAMEGGHGMMGGRHGERALDRVGASAEQKTQLRQIMEAARTDVKPLREAARSLHQQMQGHFTQPNVDARAVETLRLQLQANREQVSKRMTQALLDASRVLSPEQRKQLAERMQQRRSMAHRHRGEREALEGGASGGTNAPRRP